MECKRQLEYVQLQAIAKSPEGSPLPLQLFLSEVFSSEKECTVIVKT